MITTLIIITIVNCGALFEQRLWIFVVEYGRILIITGVGIFISFSSAWNLQWLMIALSYFLISNLWLISIKRKRAYA